MKKIFQIKGMHCRSCEMLIENEIKKIPGVSKAVAKSNKKALFVESESDVSVEVMAAVENAGYQIGKVDLPVLNKNPKHFLEIFIALMAVLLFFWFFKALKLESIFNPVSFASTNLAAVFTIGLTAGVSSCMTLVGGLILGISARHAEKHPHATTFEKFRPHLFFNLGRLAGFFFLGGVIGELGSIFRVSGPLLGGLTILVGVVMFVLGLQLTGVFPRFSSFLTLPKMFPKFFKREKNEYSHGNSLLSGVATFFLPCGFTQAMQVYAISTGSFLKGGLVMLLFALGTTPGLLGIGGLTSSIKKGNFSRIFFKTVGILIIVLATYNVINGYNLLGVKKTTRESKTTETQVSKTTESQGPTLAIDESGVQVLKSKYDPQGYADQYVIDPNNFKVLVGKPVKLEIFAESDGLGCMGSLMIPGLYNTPQFFQKGETAVMEFTPKKSGKFEITCAMGVPTGTVEVVDY